MGEISIDRIVVFDNIEIQMAFGARPFTGEKEKSRQSKSLTALLIFKKVLPLTTPILLISLFVSISLI